MNLQISDDLSLPLDFVTQTTAILARRGAGKTYTAAVLAEEIIEAGQPVVIIDPLGVFWGLRSSADGKKEGLPIIVLGGSHGDVPLEPTAGRLIAELVVNKPGAYIVDLSSFESLSAQDRFMTDFLQVLYRAKERQKAALLLIIDEADCFAPQRAQDDQKAMLGAMEAIVRRGRVRGLGVVLITQRAAVLNKNVLTQTEVLILLQTTGPQDRDAVNAWIEGNGTKEERAIVMDSLASLERGEAWIWSPSWLRTLKRVTIRRRRTFDSSATPRPGEHLVAPKRMAAVDLEKLGTEIRETADWVEDNDPKELRKEIKQLKAELAKKPAAAPAQPPGRIEVPMLSAEESRTLVNCQSHLMSANTIFNEIRDILRKREVLTRAKDRPAPARPSPMNGSSPLSPITSNGSGIRRMMVALAQRPGLTRRQLGVRAGLSSSGGSFGTYLSRLRSAGHLEERSGEMSLTSAGEQELGNYDRMPEGEDLQKYWLRELGEGGTSKILRVLCEAYPDGLEREEVGRRAGIAPAGGSFGTYLSRLRTLELIEGKSQLKASEELFS